MDSVEKLEEIELLRLQKLRAELETLQVRGEAKLAEMNRFMADVYVKHGLVNGVDQVNPVDGAIVRVKG